MPEKRATEVNEAIERRFIPVETAEMRVAADEDGTKKIVGYAAKFNQWSDDLGWFRESIAPGAFTETIKTADVRALFNHDPNIVLGRTKSGTLTLREDDTGLYMEVTPPDTQQARDLMTLIERGDVSQQSFAFRVIKESWKFGEGNEPDERTLEQVELFDVSPVTYPAYPDTSVALRSHDRTKDEHQTQSPTVTPRMTNSRIREANITTRRRLANG